MSCPHHEGLRIEGDELCPLQQLADHAITFVKALGPRAAVLVLVVDLDDARHCAIGSDIAPELAAEKLEEKARQLRELAQLAPLEPPPAELCWVGSYLAALEHNDCKPDELDAVDRVSRWLCMRGLAR